MYHSLLQSSLYLIETIACPACPPPTNSDAIILEAEKLLKENVSRGKPAYSINFNSEQCTKTVPNTCPTQLPAEETRCREQQGDKRFARAALPSSVREQRASSFQHDMWEFSLVSFRFD